MHERPESFTCIGGTPASEMKRSGIELAEAIRKRERDARERCLSTWRGVFEPSVKVHRGDEAERNRACGGNPKERAGRPRAMLEHLARCFRA